MNRPFFPLITVVALALAGAAGCAPDRMSLEPYCVCAMPDSCSFSGSCDACLIGSLAFNPSAGFPLQTPIEVRNQAPNNEDLTVGRVNSNDAHITGYTVTYAGGGPGDITLYDGSQPVPAEGSGVIWVYLAPAGAPVGRYTAEISFIGYYDNGREFESEPFPIGLDVGAYTFTCGGTDVVVCPPLTVGATTSPQNNYACGTP